MTKKSRRHRTVASVPAPAPAPPAEFPCFYSPATATNTRCTHGFVPFASEAECSAYYDAIQSLRDAITEKGKGERMTIKKQGDRSVSVCNFLNSHPQLDPERIIGNLVDMCTEMLLSLHSTMSEEDKGGVFNRCRLYGYLILDVHGILLGTRGQLTDKARLSLGEETGMFCDCDRGTVRFFIRRIPCDCLEPVLAVASSKECAFATCQLPGCNTTAGEVAGRTLLLCSGCKLHKYCSKECQHKDWARHKTICREMRKQRETESERDIAS